MRLTNDKVLLKKIEEQAIAGIYRPGSSSKDFQVCEVIATGDGRYNPMFDKHKSMCVKAGDRVLVRKELLADLDMTINGQRVKYHVIPENRVEVILDETDTI